MSAALDRLTNGYWNISLRSGANPGGLSGPGAVRANWAAMLADIAAVIAEGAQSNIEAAQAAVSALQAPGTFATSTNELTIPGVVGGLMNFSIQEAGKLFIPGDTCLLSAAAPNALNSVLGRLEAFDPVAKTVSLRVEFKAGVGTFSSWKLRLAASLDTTLTGRVAALETANAKQRSDALFIAKEFI